MTTTVREKKLLEIFRNLREREKLQVEQYTSSLREHSGTEIPSEDDGDPIAKWMGRFKGLGSTSEQYAARKEEEKRLER